MANTGEGLYLPVRVSKQSLSKDISLKDTSRKKELLVNVHYPRPENGMAHHYENVKFPVVLISPLALGGKDCYKKLAQELSTSGYICIVISHQDNIKLQRKAKGMGWLLKEGGPKKAIASVYNTPHYTFDRICDILFIIKSLRVIELSIVHLRNHILFDDVGLIGHSFGAMTAMLAAGVRVEIPQDVVATIPNEYAPKQHMDELGVTQYYWEVPKLKAVTILSPLGVEFFGLCKNSFIYNVPCMFITGSNDLSFGKEHTVEWKRQAFTLSQASGVPRILVDIGGVDHGFGDIAGSMVVSTMAGWKTDEYFETFVFRCACAFLDAYVTNNEEAHYWLSHGLLCQRLAKVCTLSGAQDFQSLAHPETSTQVSQTQTHMGQQPHIVQQPRIVQQPSQPFIEPLDSPQNHNAYIQQYSPSFNVSHNMPLPNQFAFGNNAAPNIIHEQIMQQPSPQAPLYTSMTQQATQGSFSPNFQQQEQQMYSQVAASGQQYQAKQVDHSLDMNACFIPPKDESNQQYAYLSGTTVERHSPGTTNSGQVPAYLRNLNP